ATQCRLSTGGRHPSSRWLYCSAMAAVKALNPKAEVARAHAALAVNISAARGLQDVLKSNLGPKGTMKMLVSGAGDIKLTKDGNVLLHEMQIQHPTATLIAKVATAQDDITGDGTTSNVLIIGELLKQADLYVSEGVHPRIITEGFEAAKEKALAVLEEVKVTREMDRETLLSVARTSLRTKVHKELADLLTEATQCRLSTGGRHPSSRWLYCSAMAAVKALNPKAEVARAHAALAVNISAARGLQDVLKSNLGPKGTMKMLVSGAGDIKLTKDGNVLLHEMVATAQDDITGDGTTSNVLIIGELLKQADLYVSEGVHPRIITEGFEAAKEKALAVLEEVKVTREMDRETLLSVARTSLRTKVHKELADLLTETL
ncbi:hypothetical protein CRUP_015459, partial [Coryphaenoides rupestris]